MPISSHLPKSFNILFLVFLFSGIAYPGLTQDNNYSDFLPPSPTAAELGKYGNLPKVMSNGIPGINIPLYNYSANNINVPISLSYYSDGAKVNRIASWVGLGWSLNAGGVITRMVRGMADDQFSCSYPNDITENDVQTLEYIERALNGECDTQPDLFSFNFMGYQGKFIFDREGIVRLMPHQNLIIERTIDDNKEFSEIKVKTPDGVQYFFGGDEATEITMSRSAPAACGKEYTLPEETSYFLHKIVHPTGDIVYFDYIGYGYSYVGGITQTLKVKINSEGCFDLNCAQESESNCQTIYTVTTKRLSKIHSPNYGSIVFYSPTMRQDLSGDYEMDRFEIKRSNDELYKTFDFNYEYSSNPRLFLSNVVEKGVDLEDDEKIYSFNYNDKDALPYRLSFDQDYWGYFNNAGNTDYLVPNDNMRPDLFDEKGGDRSIETESTKKGVLNKIIYPTGGYTQYDFEQNTIYETRTVSDESPINIFLYTNGWGEIGHNIVSETFFIPTDQEINLIGGYSYDEYLADPSCLIEKAKVIFSLYNVTDDYYVWNENWSPDPDPSSTRKSGDFDKKIYFKKNKKYRLKLFVVGECTYGSVSFSYNDQKAYEVKDNFDVGGLRLKRITNHDPVTNHDEITNYFYGAMDTPNESSGHVTVSDPQLFFFTQNTSKQCKDNSCEIECTDGILSSSSLKDLYANGEGHMGYEFVTISKGENFKFGGEELRFIVDQDNQNQIVRGDNILGTPYTNFGWDNGLMDRKRKFRIEGDNIPIVLNEEYTHYKPDERYEFSVPALVTKWKTEGACFKNEIVVTCDGTSRSIKNWMCDTDHKHLWQMGARRILCIASGSHNIEVVLFVDPCEGIILGDAAILYYELKNVNVMLYENKSYWYYNDYSTITSYDENGENPIVKTTEYRYDNPVHMNKTYVKTENSIESGSENDIEETYIRYPDDYDVDDLEALKTSHIVNVPIKQEIVVNGNLTGGQVIDYNNFGQPLSIFKYESNQLTPPLTFDNTTIDLTGYQEETKIDYNDDNRVNQINNRSGVNTAYIWGYNNTRAIAEIKNAEVNEVFYSGFEENGTLDPGKAKTGVKYLNSGSYYIPDTDFNPINIVDLKMSYWYWNNSSWQFSGILDFNRNINSTGSKIDELRVFPENALMSTFTYDLEKGLTSKTDPNNITTYYEYNSFGRLIKIMDQNHHLLKEFEYKYSDQ